MKYIITCLIMAASTPVFATESRSVCVVNSSEHTHWFAAQTSDDNRSLAQLTPGAQLCVPDTKLTGGTVSVYEDLEAFEGCSRLVGPAQSEKMIKYAEFDQCAWSSNS